MEEVDPFHHQSRLNIELEHKAITHGDPFMTAQIALAHINEFPRYYRALIKMEKRLKDGGQSPLVG